jgi:Tfp pilus assembly protein PilO
MKRSQVLLSVLAAVLVTALFAVFVYQPQREALADVEADIVAQEDIQAALQMELARLRAVRETAPEVEADVAMMQAILPPDSAELPSALRQLQAAADDSGVTLVLVNMGRPAPVDGAIEGLASLTVGMQLEGTYFQIVDVLRRLEDPAITPRGFDWINVTVAPVEYPELTVTLDGLAYALMQTAPAEPVEEEPTGEADGEAGEGEQTEDADTGELDVEEAA